MDYIFIITKRNACFGCTEPIAACLCGSRAHPCWMSFPTAFMRDAVPISLKRKIRGNSELWGREACCGCRAPAPS